MPGSEFNYYLRCGWGSVLIGFLTIHRIGNDHVNMQAFDRMAAIVGAFAKHMNNVSVPQPTVDGEFELIFRQMNNCTLTSESGELF